MLIILHYFFKFDLSSWLCLLRIHTKAPISCSITFDPERYRAYTASLKGEIIALSVNPSEVNSPVDIAWSFFADGPIFSALAVQIESGDVCFGTAHGTVCLLSAEGTTCLYDSWIISFSCAFE